jgi:hypothetical protein
MIAPPLSSPRAFQSRMMEEVCPFLERIHAAIDTRLTCDIVYIPFSSCWCCLFCFRVHKTYFRLLTWVIMGPRPPSSLLSWLQILGDRKGMLLGGLLALFYIYAYCLFIAHIVMLSWLSRRRFECMCHCHCCKERSSMVGFHWNETGKEL